MFSCLAFTIHGSFEFYKIVYIYSKDIFIAYIDIMWIFYYTSYLATIVFISGLIKREGQHMAILVHKAINIQWNSKVVEKVS